LVEGKTPVGAGNPSYKIIIAVTSGLMLNDQRIREIYGFHIKILFF